jgi:enoyl-CoA hydratase/carnithine racemase
VRIAVVSDVIDAEALYADVLLAAPGACLSLERDARVWGGVIWRVGAKAFSLYLTGAQELTATAAHGWRIVDALTDDAESWLAGRSMVALETGAELIIRRGGDTLERAAFARLFATGEPQEGLRAFLEKRRPRY